jgi:hypothetical protein
MSYIYIYDTSQSKGQSHYIPVSTIVSTTTTHPSSQVGDTPRIPVSTIAVHPEGDTPDSLSGMPASSSRGTKRKLAQDGGPNKKTKNTEEGQQKLLDFHFNLAVDAAAQFPSLKEAIGLLQCAYEFIDHDGGPRLVEFHTKRLQALSKDIKEDSVEGRAQLDDALFLLGVCIGKIFKMQMS